MSSCAYCSSCRLCSICRIAFIGVLVFYSISLDSRNHVSPGRVCLLATYFPIVSSKNFHCYIADGAEHIVTCSAVSKWCPHLGHFLVDLYPYSFMNFPVPDIPCLCFMTHIHRGILKLFAALRLAGTSISLVSCMSRNSQVFVDSGS
jgi:hypothetical protein